MYRAKGGFVLRQCVSPNTAMSLIRPRRTSKQLSALSIGSFLEFRRTCSGQRKRSVIFPADRTACSGVALFQF